MSSDKQSLLRLLEQIEAQIPDSNCCPKDCCKCCGPVHMTALEAERIGISRLRTLTKGELNGTNDDTCEFVDDATGRCVIYDKRPFTCRFYNSTFAGKFKCFEIPVSAGLSPREGEKVFGQYLYFLIASNCLQGFMAACDECFGVMRERERRFGWNEHQIGIVTPKGWPSHE